MKKSEIFFSTIKVPLDFIIIISSFFIAREIRLNPTISEQIKTINSDSLFYFSIVWAILYLFLFVTHWLYNIKLTNSKIAEFLDIIRYWIYWFIFFSVFVFLWKWVIYKTDIPRLIIFYTFLVWSFFVIVERIILNKIQQILIDKWFIEKKKILLVNNKKTKNLGSIIEDIKAAGIYKIIWYINLEKIEDSEHKIKYIWTIDDAQKIFESRKCDEILYIDSDFKKKDLYWLWDLSRIFGIRYRYITNTFDITKTNTELTMINKIPVIEIKNTSLWTWWRVIKRIFDIFSSLIWIILVSPIMLITAILIKISEPNWPIIYKNKRVWQNGKVFNLYKFRYLKWKYCIKESYWVDSEKDVALEYEKELIKEKSTRNWPLYKIKDDPRKTKIWNIIERYSIDELPQFFNVLIWNMSLVWPRPHQPREVEKYTIHQKRLLTIKPWITWMAQVNGRENNNFDLEAKLDTFYIENWSLLLDLKIIFKTFNTVIKR